MCPARRAPGRPQTAPAAHAPATRAHCAAPAHVCLALVQRRASGTARRRPAGGHLRHGGARRVVKALVNHDRRPCAPSWGCREAAHLPADASTVIEHARLGGQLRHRRRGKPLLTVAGEPYCAGRGSAARPCQSGTPGPCPPRRSGRRIASMKHLTDTYKVAFRWGT